MRRNGGIVLLVVLWVLTALTALVFSFSVMTRAEGHGALAFKEGMERRNLAEAGIERAIMEMIYRSINQGQRLTLEGQEIWRPDGRPYTVGSETEGSTVRITDEAGKLSLNGLTDASGILLKRLLIGNGIPPRQADVIVDSILDWKDGDDAHRLHGAERAYYQSLPQPYEARNADFESLEELILVRGVTPEVLYGDGQSKGIIPFLTVHRKAGTVNINAAPIDILAALPGADGTLAERIVAFRTAGELSGTAALKQLAGAAYPLLSPYAGVGAAATAAFTVESTGYKGKRTEGYAIVATVAMDDRHRYRYVHYKSPAGLPP